MNNSARNTRTLIVSFVVAVMALIPLRMVEVGQMANLMEMGNSVVLGETTTLEVLVVEEPMLEAPYRAMEVECVDKARAEERVKVLEMKLGQGGWTEGQVGEMLDGIRELELTKCR